MPYGETKVYFDGSHYIAIPHTTRPTKRRPKPLEEKIVVVDKVEEENGDKPLYCILEIVLLLSLLLRLAVIACALVGVAAVVTIVIIAIYRHYVKLLSNISI